MDNFKLANAAFGIALKGLNTETSEEELDAIMNLTLPDFMDYIKKTAMDELPAALLKIPVKYILMMALEMEDFETEKEEP